MCAAEVCGGAGAARPGAAEQGGPASSFEEALSLNEYYYVQPFRDTRMGGRTIPIGACDICGVVEPVSRRSSRSGTHGEWHYIHIHPLSFLILESSNTGKRSYRIEGSPSQKVRQHLEAAGTAWVRYRLYEDIRFYLGEALGEYEEPEESGI